MLTYATANDQYIFPFRDYGCWKDPTNPNIQIDPYNANAYQWANPDESPQWLRHFNTGNVLFGDGHVGRLTRGDQADLRYYSGIW